MKSRANRRIVVLSVGLGVGLFILANSGVSQSPSSSRPSTDDPFYNRPLSDSNGSSGTDSQDKKTIYDKSGTAAAPGANLFQDSSHKGRITHGKKEETMVVTKSSKPVEMKKTKFGSSDASEETGVFKGSLLDSGLSLVRKPNELRGDIKPTRSASPAAPVSPLSKPTPQATVATTAPGQKVDINLGASPVPSASASATPRP